jgi:hypothetical protein
MLVEFVADQKRLNGQLGMIGVLHKWGETLTRDVHLNCLVSGGALTDNAHGHSAKSEFLIPVNALSRCFRGKFVSALFTCWLPKLIATSKSVDGNSSIYFWCLPISWPRLF